MSALVVESDERIPLRDDYLAEASGPRKAQ
jgi:hypothetical protein